MERVYPFSQERQTLFEWSENTKEEKEDILMRDPFTKYIKYKLLSTEEHYIDPVEIRKKIDFIKKIGSNKFFHLFEHHFESSLKFNLFKGFGKETYEELCKRDLSDEEIASLSKQASFKKIFSLTPYIEYLPFQLIYPESVERVYTPEVCQDCSKAESSWIIGYVLATPVAFLRIEGCVGPEVKCMERLVQLVVKGVATDSKFFTLSNGKILRADLNENKIYQLFTTAWRILLGEIPLSMTVEFFRQSLFFYEDKITFSQIKNTPSSSIVEQLVKVFVEEKIPGYFVHPIPSGAVCGFGKEAPKKAKFYNELFSQTDKDVAKQNFFMSITGNSSVAYNFISCFSSNCYCQVMGNIFEEIRTSRLQQKLNNPGVMYLGILFSPELIKQHVIAFNQGNIENGLRNMLNLLKLMVLTQG